MCSMHLAFSSDGVRPLSSLVAGQRAVIVDVLAQEGGRADRLLALGVTPGATVTMLQTFPGIVFLCDQTELAVERGVADAVIVTPREKRS
jgi:Fe2+ transport system protein FeoA